MKNIQLTENDRINDRAMVTCDNIMSTSKKVVKKINQKYQQAFNSVRTPIEHFASLD